MKTYTWLEFGPLGEHIETATEEQIIRDARSIGDTRPTEVIIKEFLVTHWAKEVK